MEILTTPAFISAIAAMLAAIGTLIQQLRTHMVVTRVEAQTNGPLLTVQSDVQALRVSLEAVAAALAALPPAPAPHAAAPRSETGSGAPS